MKAFKSVALSTLLVAGSFAYQKPTHAEDARIPLLINEYVRNQVNLSQNPKNTDYIFLSNYFPTAIFWILDGYTQSVSRDRRYCPSALNNYTYILNRGATSQIGSITNNPIFTEQRRLTTNYCSN